MRYLAYQCSALHWLPLIGQSSPSNLWSRPSPKEEDEPIWIWIGPGTIAAKDQAVREPSASTFDMPMLGPEVEINWHVGDEMLSVTSIDTQVPVGQIWYVSISLPCSQASFAENTGAFAFRVDPVTRGSQNPEVEGAPHLSLPEPSADTLDS
jgi:hypothetical protein